MVDSNVTSGIKGLLIAAEHGRADVLQGLIKHLHDTNARADDPNQAIELQSVVDNNRRTPLHVAVEHRKIDAIRMLLSLNFPMDCRSSRNETAYEELLRDGDSPDVKKVKRVFHECLLHQIVVDNVEKVKQFVDAGIDIASPLEAVEGMQPRNQTFLHWACSSGAIGTVKLILDKISSTSMETDNAMDHHLSVLNGSERTPLNEAKHEGNVQIVEIIEEYVAKSSQQSTGKFDEKSCDSSEPINTLTTGKNGIDKSNDQYVCLLRMIEERDELIVQLRKSVEELASSRKEENMPSESSYSTTNVVLDIIRKLKREKLDLLEENGKKDLRIHQLQNELEDKSRQIDDLRSNSANSVDAVNGTNAVPQVPPSAALHSEQHTKLEETARDSFSDESSVKYVNTDESIIKHGLWETVWDIIWPFGDLDSEHDSDISSMV